MLKAEEELALPVNLTVGDIETYFQKGDFFQGSWLKQIIIKAFREGTKIRGGAANVIRDKIFDEIQRMPNVCFIEDNRTNNAFFLDSDEFIIYGVKGLRIRVWF